VNVPGLYPPSVTVPVPVFDTTMLFVGCVDPAMRHATLLEPVVASPSVTGPVPAPVLVVVCSVPDLIVVPPL
jgi:hypothetical protein